MPKLAVFSDFNKVTQTNRFATGNSTANANVSKGKRVLIQSSEKALLLIQQKFSAKLGLKQSHCGLLYRYIYHSCTVFQIHLQQSTIHKAKEFGCENFIDCSKRQNCSVQVIQLLMQSLKKKKRFLIQT